MADQVAKNEPKTNNDPKQPIRIKALQFRGPAGTTFPGGTVLSSVNSSKKDHQDSWEITFLPWMRMFRVVLVPASSALPPKSYLVPESWAIAELED